MDLKKAEGRRLALALIEKSDVVLESFRPGVMKRLGLDYDRVRQVKPDIVYCSISGYGQDGNLSHLGSHDLNYMALSGILSQLKDERGRPVHPGVTLADFIGGMAASEAILLGLFQRERTGEGRFLDMALQDVLVSFMNPHERIYQQMGRKNGISVLTGGAICYHLYETKDRRYVSMAALEPKFWRHFCEAHGRTDWIPAQFSQPARDNPVFEEIRMLFHSRTLDEWIQFSQEVDCCMAPVLEPGERERHPFFKESGLLSGSAPEDIQAATRRDCHYNEEKPVSPPRLGEHNRDVLRGLLGLSEEEIEQLLMSGVLSE